MPAPEPANVPIFILCGGRGTRLGEASALQPKPMVDLGEQPILLHIMHWYGRFGFRRFVLCTGWRSDVIATYFLSLAGLSQDFTLETRSRTVSYHQIGPSPDWEVTIAHTGIKAMTGARIALAAARYLSDAEHFAVTYGDGLTNADLAAELHFHVGHGLIGTVLGVHPPSQFGRFELHDHSAANFVEKSRMEDKWINGGYFLFRREFLQYLSVDDSCALEQEPLRRLTDAKQLAVFRHSGFWSCMDTIRDRDEMRALWESGAAPWRGEAA